MQRNIGVIIPQWFIKPVAVYGVDRGTLTAYYYGFTHKSGIVITLTHKISKPSDCQIRFRLPKKKRLQDVAILSHWDTLYPTSYWPYSPLNQIQIKLLSELDIGGESVNFSPSMHSEKWQNISKPFNRIQLLDLPNYTHLLCSRQLVNVRTETGV